MIKANELRIGNLLDNGYNLVHVTSISLDIDDEYAPIIGVCNRLENKNEVIIAEAAFGIEVKPIVLTPEWLERCGFEKAVYTDGIEYYQMDLTDYSNTFNQFNGSWKCYRVKLYNSDWYFEIHKDKTGHIPAFQEKNNHLHQLQNLFFALTGEELEIKTF